MWYPIMRLTYELLLHKVPYTGTCQMVLGVVVETVCDWRKRNVIRKPRVTDGCSHAPTNRPVVTEIPLSPNSRICHQEIPVCPGA